MSNSFPSRQTTSYRRLIDLETTSCVYWVTKLCYYYIITQTNACAMLITKEVETVVNRFEINTWPFSGVSIVDLERIQKNCVLFADFQHALTYWGNSKRGTVKCPDASLEICQTSVIELSWKSSNRQLFFAKALCHKCLLGSYICLCHPNTLCFRDMF